MPRGTQSPYAAGARNLARAPGRHHHQQHRPGSAPEHHASTSTSAKPTATAAHAGSSSLSPLRPWPQPPTRATGTLPFAPLTTMVTPRPPLAGGMQARAPPKPKPNSKSKPKHLRLQPRQHRRTSPGPDSPGIQGGTGTGEPTHQAPARLEVISDDDDDDEHSPTSSPADDNTLPAFRAAAANFEPPPSSQTAEYSTTPDRARDRKRKRASDSGTDGVLPADDRVSDDAQDQASNLQLRIKQQKATPPTLPASKSQTKLTFTPMGSSSAGQHSHSRQITALRTTSTTAPASALPVSRNDKKTLDFALTQLTIRGILDWSSESASGQSPSKPGEVTCLAGQRPSLLVTVPPLSPAESWTIRPQDIESIEMSQSTDYFAIYLRLRVHSGTQDSGARLLHDYIPGFDLAKLQNSPDAEALDVAFHFNAHTTQVRKWDAFAARLKVWRDKVSPFSFSRVSTIAPFHQRLQDFRRYDGVATRLARPSQRPASHEMEKIPRPTTSLLTKPISSFYAKPTPRPHPFSLSRAQPSSPGRKSFPPSDRFEKSRFTDLDLRPKRHAFNQSEGGESEDDVTRALKHAHAHERSRPRRSLLHSSRWGEHRRHRRRTDDTPILRFPEQGKGSVCLVQSDLHRLDDGEWLNDTVIDFALKYVHAHLEAGLPSTTRANKQDLLVLSALFYTQLVSLPDKEGYERVRKWTRGQEALGKKYIVVPINEQLHWYLAIIVYPGRILEHALPGPRENQGRHNLPADSIHHNEESEVSFSPDLLEAKSDGSAEAEKAEPGSDSLDKSSEAYTDDNDDYGSAILGSDHLSDVKRMEQEEARDEGVSPSSNTALSEPIPGEDSLAPPVAMEQDLAAPSTDPIILSQTSEADVAQATTRGQEGGGRKGDIPPNPGENRPLDYVEEWRQDDDAGVTDALRGELEGGGREPAPSSSIRKTKQQILPLVSPSSPLHRQSRALAFASATVPRPSLARPTRPSAPNSSPTPSRPRAAAESEAGDDAVGDREVVDIDPAPFSPPGRCAFTDDEASRSKGKISSWSTGRDTGGRPSAACALDQTSLPLVITFDSLRDQRGHQKVNQHLSAWLRYEAEDKHGTRIRPDVSCAYLDAIIPQQPNWWDCGIYVIHFFERFVSDPSQAMKQLRAADPSRAFWRANEVHGKRRFWLDLIRELSGPWLERYRAEQMRSNELDGSDEEVEMVARPESAPGAGGVGSGVTSPT